MIAAVVDNRGADTTSVTDRVPSVLVVDDLEDNRLAAKAVLEGAGYRVVLASGGLEAIAAFEREPTDCIILDIRMPGLDGFATCKHVRTLPRGGETPVIFLTALRDVDSFDRASHAGGDDFLNKPIQADELVTRVQSALKQRGMNAEMREQYGLLKRQRDALQRLQLQKERLMAFVVHDLKNPVNAMDLHAQVLLRDPELPPSLRESATRIRIDAMHLSRMILNLLDLSKSDEGRLSPNLADVDLRGLARDVIADLLVLAENYDVELELDVEIDHLRVDEDLLRRAITNLVENAIRHAPRASLVTLSATQSARGIDIRIVDAGPGIPLGMEEKLFEPFVQLEGDSERPPPPRTSRGLGLTFCKLVAEVHGGRIWVENANPGAAFLMHFPQT